MTVRIRLTLLTTIAMLLVGLGSCSKETPISNQVQPTPAASGDCTEGAERRFHLKQRSTAPVNPDAHLAFRLSTTEYPFSAGNCLCDVKQFEIDFNELPADTSTIEITDTYGEDVGFTIDRNLNDPWETIVIQRPARIPLGGMNIYITFSDPEYANEFVRAGGLCIINNLGGGDPVDFTEVFDEPLKLFRSPGVNSLGQPLPPDWEAYIPTAMTTNP